MQQQQSGPTSSSGPPGSGTASPNSAGGVAVSSSGGTLASAATAYPIDLASASKVLVRPTEKTNMPTTYRIGNSAGNQMRVVIPSNATPQTYYRQTINLKPDTTANRAQITALPARTVSQASITVSRPQTPTTYHVPARVQTTVAAGIQGPRATITAPIRIPTPPISVANLNTYVRQSVPPSRTSSPSSATIISQQGGAPTWMPNVQVQVPSQLIRAANITSAPRARVVAQTIPAGGGVSNQNATITANVVSQASPQSVVSLSGASNPSQAFVATLSPAGLAPQRQITSTLVYTNNSGTPQSYPSGTINPQRVTLATTTLSPQRASGVRPIQRLPTANIGVRVPAGSISIRTPPVPVLAPTVLTTIASGGAGGAQSRTGTVSTANISNTIPARIIQVQNPQGGQVITGGRLPTNLLNIQPLIVSNNRIPSSIQPSLTIAQVSKLTPVSNSSTPTSLESGGTTTLQTASGQQIVVSSASMGNLMSNQGGGQSQGQITQIVNVNAGSVGSASQIVTVSQGQVIGGPQSLSVSNSGSGGSGTTTVIPIPLAITGGRNAGGIPVSVATLAGGQNSISIVSGGGSTITGIVRTTTSGPGLGGGPSLSTSASMPSILPIAKVTPHLMETVSSSSSTPYSVSGSGTSLYIQTRPQQQNAIVTTVASTGKSNTLNVVSGSGGPFLPTSTFYYERVTPSPASSSSQPLPPVVTSTGTLGLSQGVSTLTSTAITTTSSLSGPVFSISSSALNSSVGSTLVTSNVITTSGSSLASTGSAGSFAIVAGRNLTGTIQPPSSVSTSQTFQSVPVRFQPQLLVDGGQAQPIIMTSGGNSVATSAQSLQPAPHMLIPVNPAGAGSGTKLESPQSSILRKRALEGSPIKAGKDLTQTLIAMGKERFREKERERERERNEREMSPPSRPVSTDGSTTVSATSSPGLDQQEQEEIKAMAYANRNANADLPFKPLHEEIFHTNQAPPPSQHQPITLESIQAAMQSQQNATAAAANGSSYEQSPRKKPRKQNVAEGLKAGANSLQFYAAGAASNNSTELDVRMDTSASSLPGEVNFGPVPLLAPPPPTASTTPAPKHNKQTNNSNNASSNNISANNSLDASSLKVEAASAAVTSSTTTATSSSANAAAGGSKKDGATAAPKDSLAARKARNASLLESYKQSWKAANNHFQRYTDVKQREERRPTIVDIANQSHVLQKVNGWKVYHLSAQIEDLCELESQAYDKLDQMLKSTEAAPKQSPEIERINELLKGNMQRSKIITDGINEARTQIMKIFDHKTHVSDIIQRCASKRNFKKREKT
ncbi:mucin-19 [Culex pipiens pallens]|uniref:mucin-19 n=1 Tax=Culex pipiens pallens TaxID=42434 RepID=UPI001954A70C|nr:mucin-19 [Culex pipiens pallens]